MSCLASALTAGFSPSKYPELYHYTPKRSEGPLSSDRPLPCCCICPPCVPGRPDPTVRDTPYQVSHRPRSPIDSTLRLYLFCPCYRNDSQDFTYGSGYRGQIAMACSKQRTASWLCGVSHPLSFHLIAPSIWLLIVMFCSLGCELGQTHSRKFSRANSSNCWSVRPVRAPSCSRVAMAQRASALA